MTWKERRKHEQTGHQADCRVLLSGHSGKTPRDAGSQGRTAGPRHASAEQGGGDGGGPLLPEERHPDSPRGNRSARRTPEKLGLLSGGFSGDRERGRRRAAGSLRTRRRRRHSLLAQILYNEPRGENLEKSGKSGFSGRRAKETGRVFPEVRGAAAFHHGAGNASVHCGVLPDSAVSEGGGSRFLSS